MTEDQASVKWCPMARVALVGGTESIAPVNRWLNSYGEEQFSTCVGSACMMWRTEGYCGLAGHP